MQEAEEQDTCRICGAPAEPDQPLFHPCKCSGTIRYIHQDCLTTWLAHSKRKVCDVCKHPYSFTKVYAPNMPSHLPPLLLVRRLIQQFLFAILFVIRVVVVALMWLAVLPWITVWTWRMYFAMGETTAWWISSRPRNHHNETITSLFQRVRNDGAQTLFSQLITHPAWVSLSADIFSGQIIAACIVLTFVSIFLLREWIAQNARPGLFEDDDFVPEEQRIPVPVPPEPAPARVPAVHRIQGFPDAEAFARQQAEALRALELLRNRERHPLRAEHDRELRARRRFNNGGYAVDPQRLYAVDDSAQLAELRRKPKDLRAVAAKRRAMTERNRVRLRNAPLPPADKRFQFTFEKPIPRESEAGPSHRDSIPIVDTRPEPEISLPPLPPFPSQEPSRHTAHVDNDAPSRLTVRRPTLPASTIATANHDHSFTISPSRTPVTSPGLATYHPPEELMDPGSSRDHGDYFEAGEEGSSSTQELPSQDLQASLGREVSEAESSQSSTTAVRGESLTLLTDSETETEEDEEIAGRAVADNDQGQNDERPLFFEGHAFGDAEEEDEEEDDADLFFVDPEEVEARRAEAPAPDAAEEVNGAEGNGNAQVVNDDVQAANDNGDGFDDFDGDVGEDMDGALEAVGIRGPIFGVLQNAALMVFVLDTAIGLCIWIPYTIGKTSALLALDPHRCLQLLHLPIRGMRLVTDPVVDSLAYVVTHFLLPPWINAFKRVVFTIAQVLARVAEAALGKNAVDQVSTYSGKLYEQSVEVCRTQLSNLVSSPPSNGTIAEPEYLFPEYARFLEPYFAQLGKEVRVLGHASKESWKELAVGDGTVERVFAVCLGYFVLALILAAYLNLFTVGNARTAGRAVRNVIRQQLLVIKVASFIFVELAVFPLGCGVVLDICTVWLFPEANLQSRAAFFTQAPMTAMFYHWIAGTLFMYSFAILLSGCRSIMRPGAMWFVKDPEDRNAHPIRDILERHTLTQLRKIVISGLMYSCVVACVVGSVASLLILGNRSILPFRWKNREPLSNVPIDLLFLHLVLPQTMHHFRPKRAVRNWATRIWKFFARWFRLTSYFFGGRHPEEEIPSRQWWFGQTSVAGDAFEGSFRRVPATDYIALGRDVRATARVNEDGSPFDEEAASLIEQQNREAEKAQHDPSKDYMIVYLPPYFRYRLFAFMLSMWTTCAIMFGFAVAFPIQLGRSVFSVFTPREVHDGYSLLLGFYLLWACYLFGKAIDRLDKRRQRVRVDDGPNADLRLLVLKRGLLWTAKTLYMSLSLGVVVPILLALVMDLYVVLPIRKALAPGAVPRVRLVDAWALGLVYGKIALHVTQLHPPNEVTRGLHNIVSNGWVRLDPVKATREVIAPLIGGLLGMIVFPGLSLQLVRYAIPSLKDRYGFIPVSIYPSIFVIAGFIRSAVVVYDVLSTWSQTVRDTEFLVELRLRNHEPESEQAKASNQENTEPHDPDTQDPPVRLEYIGPDRDRVGEWVPGEAGE